MNVYRLNDYEWYAGATLEEAVAAAMADSGSEHDDVLDDDYGYAASKDTPVLLDDGTTTTIGTLVSTMTAPGYVCGTET